MWGRVLLANATDRVMFGRFRQWARLAHNWPFLEHRFIRHCTWPNFCLNVWVVFSSIEAIVPRLFKSVNCRK